MATVCGTSMSMMDSGVPLEQPCAGIAMGLRLRKPLLLAECVPGGTTTALAVLTGIGLSVGEFISGSTRKPAVNLKKSKLMRIYMFIVLVDTDLL